MSGSLGGPFSGGDARGTLSCKTGNSDGIEHQNRQFAIIAGACGERKHRRICHFLFLEKPSLLFDRTGALIDRIRAIDPREQVFLPENRNRHQARRAAQRSCSSQASGSWPRTIFSKVKVAGCVPAMIEAWRAGDRKASRASLRS